MKKSFFLILISLLIHGLISAQSCLPDGIIFNSQAAIDSFQINYPNCTEIEGSVSISGEDITSLDGLNSLTAIGGGLAILQNPVLNNLAGLDNIYSINEYLVFLMNDSLANIAALENLTFMGGYMDIAFNHSLTDLSGLDNLDSIGGHLYIHGNDAFQSLTGLNEIIHIEGDVQIWSNTSLTELTGLDNLTSIGGHLVIESNNALINFTGLNNLTSIGGYLKIKENNALINLTGLHNINSIEYLQVWDNPGLTSLTGMEGLTSVELYISIRDNVSLLSLSGIDHIEAATIQNLYIVGNTSLTTCEVESVCNYIAQPNGEIIIGSNGTGCANQEEVEDACEGLGVQDNYAATAISIYPNPSNKLMSITNKQDILINEVIIYDGIGQKVLHQVGSNPTLDISALNPGLYLVEIVSGKLKYRKKLIVNK
ncbi:MAG: T9SS type A sorting domain-containing protein [Bacteroidetes bacterium]|nr:T9SS type A sorting domain-containing protein [Bacteroidota bacterium]